MRILFVCTGNTCRSPFAEAVARRAAPRGLEVGSAGIKASAAAAPTDSGIEAARDLGLDLQRHRSRSLTPEMIARADLVVGMTRDQVRWIERHGGSGRARVLGGADVEDPFGGGPEAYARIYTRIEADVRALLAEPT
jgi:protein-tyrosine-phosphatase